MQLGRGTWVREHLGARCAKRKFNQGINLGLKPQFFDHNFSYILIIDKTSLQRGLAGSRPNP